MTRHRFLLTGFGRSGTAFLSTVLGRSRRWRVAHEPAGDRDSLERASGRFSECDYYGEVNSRLRHWLHEIPAERKALLLRDPRQIAVSVFNRHPREVMARLEGVWELLAGYLEDGVTAFYFHEFTTCPRSLQALVRWTGVDDVEVEASWLELPVNATRTPTITSYRQIPESIRHAIDPPIRRFLADYFPEQTA